MTDGNSSNENQVVVDFAAARSAKDRAHQEQDEKVCGFKPSSAVPATNAVIERGKAALIRLEHDKQTWPDWCDACKSQFAIQTLAMMAAQTNTPHGPRYRKAVKHFLACHKFDRINKGTRSLMCEVARNLDAIESWRSTLPPEELIELNHPRVVLAHWKRSLRSASDQDSEEPEVDEANPMLVGWNKATLEQRTTGLTKVGFDDFRQVMPGDWCKPMKECVARLRAEDRDPDSRITRAFQKALEHVEIAGDPRTSDPVAQGHQKEALDELRGALKALHATKRRVHDLDVGISTSPKAKRRSS
jgi:hypothetical protein